MSRERDVLVVPLSLLDRIALAALIRREIGRVQRKRAKALAAGWQPEPGKRDANDYKIDCLKVLLAKCHVPPGAAHESEVS